MNRKAGVLGALWLWLFVGYLDRVAIAFAGPAIMLSLALSPAAFGIVLSAFGVGNFLAQIPGGLLADKWGARRLLILGPFVWALFIGATALVVTAAGFVIVRAALGIAEGMTITSVNKCIADNFASRERARAFSICMTALPLAPLAAGGLVGLLLGYGWQAMFLAMILPSLLAGIVSRLLIPALPTEAKAETHGDTRSFGDVLRLPSLWVVSLATFAFVMADWGFLSWMPTYLARAHQIDLKALGPIASIPYLFGFAGLLLGGWLGTALHLRRPQILAAFYVSAGLFLFLAFRADTLASCLAGLSGTAFFVFGSQALKGAVTLDLAPRKYQASYLGVYNTAGQIGGAIAPAIMGFLIQASGSFASGFIFMGASFGVAALAILLVIPLMPCRAARHPSAA